MHLIKCYPALSLQGSSQTLPLKSSLKKSLEPQVSLRSWYLDHRNFVLETKKVISSQLPESEQGNLSREIISPTMKADQGVAWRSWGSVFSCPEQLNRWPCHSVSQWVSQWVSQCVGARNECVSVWASEWVRECVSVSVNGLDEWESERVS